jgi:hypothetical protein
MMRLRSVGEVPLGPRLEPPRPWWVKWIVLAIFAASVAVVPVLVWLLGLSASS